jgi:hypothetical protein
MPEAVSIAAVSSAGAGRILGGGLTAGLSRLVSTIRRLKAVNRAFNDTERYIPRAIEIATADIERVLGRNGVFTENVSTFLKELHRSGIITRLAEGVLLDMPSPGVGVAFRHLFLKYIPDGLNIDDQGKKTNLRFDDFYDKFGNMLRRSFERQTGSEMAAFLASTQGKAVKSQYAEEDRRFLEALELEDPRHPQGTKIPVSWLKLGSETNYHFSTIAQASVQQHLEIWVFGPNERTELIAVEDIFVGCDLEAWPSATRKVRQISNGSVAAENPEAIKFENFRRTAHRAVVLGNPGGGKSTLVKKICLDSARAAAVGDGPIPVMVEVRNYHAARHKDPQLGLFNFIARQISEEGKIAAGPKLEETIRYLLAYGQILLVFDGIDEVLDEGRRKTYVAEVVRFANTWPLCSILVTSREVGYERAPLPKEIFEHKIVSPLSRPQVSEFSRRYATIIHRETPEIAERAAQEIHVSTASDIVTNPLMLALIVWLFHVRHGDMPNNRADLYDQCAKLLFERWDKNREILPEMPDNFQLLHLLNELASEFYLRAEHSGGMTRKDLEASISKYLEAQWRSDNKARARSSAAAVVEFITGRAWVLTDVGTDQYQFVHRTFLEYFFARYLDDAFQTVEELVNELKEKIVIGQWHVPGHLSLQRKLPGKPRSHERTATCLAKIAKETPPSIDVARFLAESFSYLLASEQLIEELAGELMRIVVSMREAGGRNPATVEALLFPSESVVPHVQASIYRGLARSMAALIDRRVDPRQFGWMVDYVCLRQHMMSDEYSETRELDQLLITAFREALGKSLEQGADRDVAFAKAAFDINGTIHPQSAAFGFRLWNEPISRHDRCDWMPADICLALHELEKLSEGKIELEYAPRVQLFLAVSEHFFAEQSYHLETSDLLMAARKVPKFSKTIQNLHNKPQLALLGVTLGAALLEILNFTPDILKIDPEWKNFDVHVAAQLARLSPSIREQHPLKIERLEQSLTGEKHLFLSNLRTRREAQISTL